MYVVNKNKSFIKDFVDNESDKTKEEEILWSLSDDNDVENFINNTNHCVQKVCRKRKRKRKENKLCNLDITVKRSDNDERICKSPILRHKEAIKNANISPILKSNQKYTCVLIKKEPLSPVKTENVLTGKENYSPILQNKVIKITRNAQRNVKKRLKYPDANKEQLHIKIKKELPEVEIKKECGDSNGDLVNRIKTFFKNEFRSLSNSQVSIDNEISVGSNENILNAEISDSTSVCQEEISELSNYETITCTDHATGFDDKYNATSLISLDELGTRKRKKKYKKDGLAFRLQNLLRKQKTAVSLWRHEMFLSTKTSFVLPNSNNYKLFNIVSFSCEYGNHLINSYDEYKICNILVNSSFLNNVCFKKGSLLKVYEPYEVLNNFHKDGNNTITYYNICKFECLELKQE